MEAVSERSAKFQGFSSPNYTMVPDQLFDELLASLSGNEIKVLLYIIRRTFGFKRDSDNISLSQMLCGIRTADGRVLDRGVGMSKPTLLKALGSLKAQNIIIARQRRSAEKGDEATSYSLNIRHRTVEPPGPNASPRGHEQGAALLGGQEPLPRGVKVLGHAGDKETRPPRGKEPSPHNTQLGQTVSIETKQQHTPRPVQPEQLDDCVVVALTDLGVTKKTAIELARMRSPELIRGQIDMLSFRAADHPAAVLVKAIREEWAPPAGYQAPAQRAAEAREGERIEAELETWRQAQAAAKETRDTGRVHSNRHAADFRPFEATALDSRTVWATTVLDLRSHDGAEAYLRGTRLLAREGDELVVGAGTAYAAEWLQRRIAHRAAQLLSALSGERVGVRFVAEGVWRGSRDSA